jgi:23S rRNA G2445 N2-methylase RlmL
MSSTSQPAIELLATAAAGAEAVVKRELEALGYPARTLTAGRLLFQGDALAI